MCSLQPVQRMSYFKGQDGGRSQVTSFYRSTPQTTMRPSCARQRGAPCHSTGELPDQSFSFTCCFLLCSACVTVHLHYFIAAPTKTKEGTTGIANLFKKHFAGHEKLKGESRHHPAERKVSRGKS